MRTLGGDFSKGKHFVSDEFIVFTEEICRSNKRVHREQIAIRLDVESAFAKITSV